MWSELQETQRWKLYETLSLLTSFNGLSCKTRLATAARDASITPTDVSFLNTSTNVSPTPESTNVSLRTPVDLDNPLTS